MSSFLVKVKMAAPPRHVLLPSGKGPDILLRGDRRLGLSLNAWRK